MGIGYPAAYFLCNCSIISNSLIGNVDFSQTITLGRQAFGPSKHACEKLFEECLNVSATQKARFYKELENATSPRFPDTRYCEPFIKLLHNDKNATVDSLDYSNYEAATIIHDITIPITRELKNKYTCVIDGGLLEHVFDYPAALKNAMDMVAIGGHLILITPGNNWFGHGFYQFSPEVFYSILRRENGFEDTQIYLTNSNKWYLVQNPRVMHRRVECSPKWPDVSMYVVSKKTGEVPDKLTAHQSDYEDTWSSKKYISNKESTLITILKKIHQHSPRELRRHSLQVYRKLFYKRIFARAFCQIDFGAHPR